MLVAKKYPNCLFQECSKWMKSIFKNNMTHLQMLQRRRRSDVSEIYGYKCDIYIEDLLLPRL